MSVLSDSFAAKLGCVDIAALGLEPYPVAYFTHLHAHLPYYTLIYEQIIKLAVQAAQKPASQLKVLDYGGGNGLLGMFAKEWGFEKVWINDRSARFLAAAERTAQRAGIHIDGFINGDVDRVVHFFESAGEKPDILLATDVIEHIYHLPSFFAGLKKLNASLIHVFTTASNPYNYLKVKALHKLQYTDEYIGYEKDVPSGNAATGQEPALSFYEQRKQIIQNGFPNLSAATISLLAEKTRGKRKDDIITAVTGFVNTGVLPAPEKNRRATCDPETGSWTERILPVHVYKEIYRQNGFSFQMFNGFYNESSKKGSRLHITRLLNTFMHAAPVVGKYAAPYIVFLGKPT